MKIRSLLIAAFLLSIAAAAWAGQAPAGLVYLQATNLDEALSIARQTGLPVYLKLEDGLVVGGSRHDALRAAGKGIQARHLGDVTPDGAYLITGKTPLRREEVSRLGQILVESGNAFVVRADDGMDRKLMPLGAMAVPLPEEPLPIHPTPKLSGKGLTYDPAIAALAAQVDTAQVRNYLLRLQAMGTRFMLAQNRFEVADSIRQWFLDMGIADVRLDTFYTSHYDPWGNNMQVNVVATMPGTEDTSSCLIVGGHHDAITYTDPYLHAPGVDDNGTGSVAALEMARVLASNPPARTVRLVTFAAEEYGLYGSFHYAAQAYQQGMRIFGMFNYDMIGHYENTTTYRVYRYSGAEYLGDLLGQATQLYTYLTPIYGTGGYGSDSYPFWAYGFPATWGFETIFSTKYHSDQDSITYVSVPYCAEVIRAGLAAVASVARHPDIVRGLTITDVGDGSRLVVNWEPNHENNIDGYWVYYGRQSGQYQDSSWVVVNNDTLEGLMTDSLYYVSVRAQNTVGYVSLAAFEINGIPRLAPDATANLRAAPVAQGIELTWRQNTELDLSGYRLYRAVDDTSSYDSLNTALLLDTTFTDQPLSGAHRYYYKVRAFDHDGNYSPLSERAYGRPVTLDQGVLVVDETKNWTTGPWPRDTAQDSFYDYVLEGIAHQQYDMGNTTQRPLLADLVPFSTVLWHGDDYTELMASGSTADLRTYLDFGGNLWLTGWKMAGNIRGITSYPFTLPDTAFLRSYLKIEAVDQSGNNDSFRLASGLLGYPGVAVDTLKVPVPSWGKTMRWIEAYTPAAGGEAVYLMDMKNLSSPFQGSVCGLRYLGPTYRTAVFGFPLLFMDRDQARLAAQRVMADFGETGVASKPESGRQKAELMLSPNVPNPFSQSTIINYQLAKPGRVSLRVYNIAGQAVRTLVSELKVAGWHQIKWDGKNDQGRDIPGGVYFARLATAEGSRTIKITMLK